MSLIIPLRNNNYYGNFTVTLHLLFVLPDRWWLKCTAKTCSSAEQKPNTRDLYSSINRRVKIEHSIIIIINIIIITINVCCVTDFWWGNLKERNTWPTKS